MLNLMYGRLLWKVVVVEKRKRRTTGADRPFCRPIYGLKGSEYPYLVLPLVSAGKCVFFVMKDLFSVRGCCRSRTVLPGGGEWLLLERGRIRLQLVCKGGLKVGRGGGSLLLLLEEGKGPEG